MIYIASIRAAGRLLMFRRISEPLPLALALLHRIGDVFSHDEDFETFSYSGLTQDNGGIFSGRLWLPGRPRGSA
jgi:hypothetical protein